MKPRLTLYRIAHLSTGVFGMMNLRSGLTLFTVEQPWRLNARDVSCIPEGTYDVVPGFFYTGGYPCLEVLDVVGRSLIKFHRANWPSELKGCIAPNLQLAGDRGSLLRGVSSQPALDALMADYPDGFTLTIESVHSRLEKPPADGAARDA